jgi:hypothetical protein
MSGPRFSDPDARRKAGPEYIRNPPPYCSNPDLYTEDPLAEPNLAKLALAEEEARSLLVDNDNTASFLDDDQPVHVKPWLFTYGTATARVALGESLSAFLAAPDPAAFLVDAATVQTFLDLTR